MATTDAIRSIRAIREQRAGELRRLREQAIKKMSLDLTHATGFVDDGDEDEQPVVLTPSMKRAIQRHRDFNQANDIQVCETCPYPAYVKMTVERLGNPNSVHAKYYCNSCWSILVRRTVDAPLI